MFRILTFLWLVQNCLSTDWCKLNCELSVNAMCGNSCSGKCIPMDPDKYWRRYILDLHNHYRNRVAKGDEKRGSNGPAANMNILNYDMDLEYTAACYIYTANVPRRATCRKTPKYERVGQNIYYGGLEPRVLEAINSSLMIWYDEAEKTTASIIDSYVGTDANLNATAEYTQMVWAETTHLGCARCLSMLGNFLVACNYGPAGNFRGIPVYRRGKAASKCKQKGVSKRFTSLCGSAVYPAGFDQRGLENICVRSVINLYSLFLAIFCLGNNVHSIFY